MTPEHLSAAGTHDGRDTTGSDLFYDRTARFAAVFAIVLASVEIVVDAVTWIELDIAAIHGLPLVRAAVTRSRRLLWR